MSSGSPPAAAGLAFKLLMEQLQGKREMTAHNIEYALPWVPADKVAVCKGDVVTADCNTLAAGKVPDSFVTEVFDQVLLPEISLQSATEGTPTPGATIQPLPADAARAAANEPGINCAKCDAPANLYQLTKIAPFDAK